MTIRYIDSNDKYVQYRLIALTWSITESDWQGVDDEPTALSENLTKSGGIKTESYRLENFINGLETPSTRTLGWLDENGGWTSYDSRFGHIVVDVSKYIGKKITAQMVIEDSHMQYAFLSSYEVGQRATFAPGCSRESGCPEDVTIPEGTKYLYVYLFTYEGVPHVYINGLTDIKIAELHNGSIFDLSSYNNNTVYANLSAALLAMNNVETAYKQGGINIKFIQEFLAQYSLIKATSSEQPSGTQIYTDPSIDSGTYIASQLSAFSILPTSTGSVNAITYWMEVSGDATTYVFWTITLIQTDSNEYVQYRLMKNSWSTDISDWQGMDNDPTPLSKNLVESGGVKNQLYDLENLIDGIEIPNERTLGYLDGDAGWRNSDYLGHIVIDVSEFIGEKVTVQKVYKTMQYAFLSSYEVGQRATFAPGCSRENGCPENITIPEGTKYLYVYINRCEIVPKVYIKELTKERLNYVYEEFPKLQNEVRSIEMPSTVTNGYLYESGSWTDSDQFHHIVVNVSNFIGMKISADYSVQYAFLSTYSIGQNATLAPGCVRENGTPKDLIIPNGANYLYLYIQRSTTVPKVYINELVEKLESMVLKHESALSEVDKNINP